MYAKKTGEFFPPKRLGGSAFSKQVVERRIADGVAVNVIQYAYAPADAKGNGQIDFFDVGVFETCFSQSPPTDVRRTFDLRPDNSIDLFDLADLTANLAGP